jgi:hypothetical protein
MQKKILKVPEGYEVVFSIPLADRRNMPFTAPKGEAEGIRSHRQLRGAFLLPEV